MKVLLINPTENIQNNFYGPPLGLLYLAGSLEKNNINVDLIDGCVYGWKAIINKVRKYKPDIVGITCLTPIRKKVLKIAQTVKKINKNILIVLGGVHPTIMYKQILKHYSFIDICVLGEGEQTMVEIAQNKPITEIRGIAYSSNKNIFFTKPRIYTKNIDNIPFPAWHLIDLNKYLPWGKGIHNGINLEKEVRIPVIFSRGCVGKCTFCSTWWIWRNWRHRSAQNMADELSFIYERYNKSHFCFLDDSFSVDINATINLCDEIIKRKLKIAFHITTRTDCINEEVLKKLRKAGCYEIAYGIETASPILLDKMHKNNNINNSIKAINLTKNVGIKTTALIIVGSMGETKKTINQTIDFLNKVKPDNIGTVGGLWILPGTKLYFDCKKYGYINDDFWLNDEPYKLYTKEHSHNELMRFKSAIKSRVKLI